MPKNAKTPTSSAKKSKTQPKNATSSVPEPQTETIADKIQRLDDAVEWFYSDEFNLDQALDRYEAATELAAAVEHDLATLQNEVEVIADLAQG